MKLQFEQMEEEMFLGLRKTEGVSFPHFIRTFSIEPLQIFLKKINRTELQKVDIDN